VSGPAVNELSEGTLHGNPPMLLFVVIPKPDRLLPDVADAILSNGWTPHVAADIFQELLFRFEGSDIDAPPPFLLLRKQHFH
jgi:hypothetical protein